MSDAAVQQLSDGRLQVFVIESGGTVFSRWKTSTNPDGPWSPWSPFPSPDGLPPGVHLTSITAGRLEDGRIQLFAIDGNNGKWSSWKTSKDPNSAWTKWSNFS